MAGDATALIDRKGGLTAILCLYLFFQIFHLIDFPWIFGQLMPVFEDKLWMYSQ